MLPLNLSDPAATSHDASSLEFIAPIAVGSAIFRTQEAEGCDLALILAQYSEPNFLSSFSMEIKVFISRLK